MNKLLFLAISLLLFSCSPSSYTVESNPEGRDISKAYTDVVLENKTAECVDFHVVPSNGKGEGTLVSVPANGKEVLHSFVCGRYNVYVKGELLESLVFQPKHKNELTYEN